MKKVFTSFIFSLTIAVLSLLLSTKSVNAQAIDCCPIGSNEGDYCMYSLDPPTMGVCRPWSGVYEYHCSTDPGMDQSGYVCDLSSEPPVDSGWFFCMCAWFPQNESWNCQSTHNECGEGYFPDTQECHPNTSENPCDPETSCAIDCVEGTPGGYGDPCTGPSDCEDGLVCNLQNVCVRPDDPMDLQCCEVSSDCNEHYPYTVTCEPVAGTECPSGRECAWAAPPDYCCVFDGDCPPRSGYTASCTMHVYECPTRACLYTLIGGGGGGGGGDTAVDWDKLYDQLDWGFGEDPTTGSIISRLVLFLFPIAGLLLLLYLIYGGFMFLTSAGDPNKAQAAKGIITTALVGFIIIFTSYWIVQIIGRVLGLGDIVGIF